MKIVARMPLLVRGQPKRNNGPRDIFVAKDVQWEIPEISLSEMEIVFSAREKVVRVQDGMIGPMTTYRMDRMTRRDGAYVLRELDGELYRKVADADTDPTRLFFTAFPVTWEQHYHGEDYDISFEDKSFPDRTKRTAISLVTYAVYKQLAWHQSCRWVQDHESTHTWPSSTNVGTPAFHDINSRNYATFEDHLPRIIDFDKAQYDACMEMYPLQLSRLVIADGELWMKTPPPVLRVRPQYEMQATSAIVSICLAPDRHDVRLTDAIFSLDARDEAFAYAQQFAAISGGDRARYTAFSSECGNVYDCTVDYEVRDERLLAFDHQTEEVRRFSCAMAAELRRFVCRNQAWVEKRGVSAEDIAGVHQSFDEVMATNYITGQFGDASPWMERNFEVWRKTGRRHSTYQFGGTHISDLLLERARRYDESRPIHFGLRDLARNPIRGA